MSPQILVPADGTEPEVVADPEPIHFSHVIPGRPGRKTAVAMDIPAPWDDDGAAKDTLKELEFHRSGRSWDGEQWTVFITALNRVIEHMCAAGYDVTVSPNVAKEFERGVGGNTANGRVFLPNRRESEAVVDEDTLAEARSVEAGDALVVRRSDTDDVQGIVHEVHRYDDSTGVSIDFKRESDGHMMRLSVFSDGINLHTHRAQEFGKQDNGHLATVESDVSFSVPA